MRSPRLNKIENIRMMGDRFHNDTIDILFNGVNRRSKYAKRIMFRLDNVYVSEEPTNGSVSSEWCPLTNTMCRKLNGLMKSKTAETFQKRLVKYVTFLAYGTHYGKLFNKDQILELLKERV